jgi:hypothetical protein
MDRIQDFEINSPRWLSLENFEGEVWKPILGYESIYEISNYGRIKCLPKNGRETFVKKIFMAKHRCNYWIAELYKDNKRKRFSLHRLVAIAFIPNPDNLPQVNHKDEDKTNNSLDNLELLTHTENINYGTRTERASISNSIVQKGRKFTKEHIGKLALAHSKPILQYNLQTNQPIKEWQSANEAARELGYNSSTIGKVARGIYSQAYGYGWRYI